MGRCSIRSITDALPPALIAQVAWARQSRQQPHWLSTGTSRRQPAHWPTACCRPQVQQPRQNRPGCPQAKRPVQEAVGLLSLIFPIVAVAKSHRRQRAAVPSLGHDGRNRRPGRGFLNTDLPARTLDLLGLGDQQIAGLAAEARARTNPASTPVSNCSGSSAETGSQNSRGSRTTAGADPSLLTFGPTAHRSDTMRTLQESRGYVTRLQAPRKRWNPWPPGQDLSWAQGVKAATDFVVIHSHLWSCVLCASAL